MVLMSDIIGVVVNSATTLKGLSFSDLVGFPDSNTFPSIKRTK